MVRSGLMLRSCVSIASRTYLNKPKKTILFNYFILQPNTKKSLTLPDLKADLECLKADLTGEVLTVEDTDFEDARAVWNAAVTGQPLLIVLPKNTRDVVLGVDNVISAELVLADGTIRTASAQENPELLWAIRGGGGNFGVVTSLRVRLHEVKPFLSGMILFRESDAQVVLQKHNQLMATAPNELAVSAGMLFAPDGQPVVFLMPFWFGDPSAGDRYLEHMKQFAEPVQAQVGLMTYSDMLDFQSSFNKQGLHVVIQTRWLPSLEEDQIQILIQAVNQATSPRALINMHHFHGAPTTVGENETPFPMRKPHYMVEIIAWEETKEAHNSQQYQQWASRVSGELKNGAHPGGYANLLGPDETEQIRHAYGDNLPRLQQAKRTYDPGKVFNGIAIPNG